MAEYSADRVGLAACSRDNRLQTAFSALLKTAVGSELAGKVDVHDLLRISLKDRRNVFAILSEFGSTHPYLANRMIKLLDFAYSRSFQRYALNTDSGKP